MTMTAKKQTAAKQKAVEIFDKFHNYTLTDWDKKQCALIAVEYAYKECCSHCDDPIFWQQVRAEIEKL